jgi:Putative bacterial sensory transduction regulator
MSDATITKLTLDSLRESLQQAGYRVETVTDPVANVPYLRSATAGLPFDIRPGNRFAGDERSFADLAFVAVLQVQGELPLDLVNRWNATRRFARLQLSQPFLVFCLDVSIAGGVAPNHLRAQVEIWDRLVQELIAYLREELGKLSAANGIKPANPREASQAHQPERDRGAEPDPLEILQ